MTQHLDSMSHETQGRTSTSLPEANPFHESATSPGHLTDTQLDRLYRCANGNTLRFEASSIVDALVAAGYAKEGVGRVVTVTATGQQYLQAYSVRLRLARLGALR